jgi:hypothetical protein
MSASLILVVGVGVTSRANLGIGARQLRRVRDVVDSLVAEDAIEISVDTVRKVRLGDQEAFPGVDFCHIHDIGLGVAEKAFLVGDIHLPDAGGRCPDR